MKYKINISNEAKTDLAGIYEYIAFQLAAPINALGQLERLESNITKLNELPERFPLYSGEPWNTRGMRYMIVDNYIVFYINDNTDKEVIILRVLYGGRDIGKIFKSIE